MPADSKLFSKYKNSIFVETGSLRGDGIQSAIESGFKELHSIELSEKLYNLCKIRFAMKPEVKLYLGNSSKILRSVISNIQEPITFWLDGHYSGKGTAYEDKISPLLDELSIIAKHPIKTHTIIIDDLRCWNIEDKTVNFGVNEIKEKLKMINPEYQFIIEDSTVVKNDILVARMPVVHLVTLFSRHDLLPALLKVYTLMGIIWHLIQFQNEKLLQLDGWVQPFIIPKNLVLLDKKIGDWRGELLGAINYFIKNAEIVDDEYYVCPSDDDLYEEGVFDKIKKMNDDVVVISMKRGDNWPTEKTIGLHGPNTLFASEKNMKVGYVGGEQLFVKGRVFKKYLYREDYYGADGLMAEYLKSNYKVRYEPNLFAMFNYFQPGRWNRGRYDRHVHIF